MGFDPVFIIKDYKFPKVFKDPNLSELMHHFQLFNEVVMKNNVSVTYPDKQYLTPEKMKHLHTVKEILNISALSDEKTINYIKDPHNAIGVIASFRLSELISPEVIENFRNPNQDVIDTKAKKSYQPFKTHFRSPFASKDDGTRTSLLINEHPSLIDHGVIPPFWPILRMYRFANENKIEWKGKPPEDVAKEFEEKGCYNEYPPVDPYLRGMLHHIQREFDTGAIILTTKNNTPIDLNKSMWENYFTMQDMIVESILAAAAGYKLGLDMNGVKQDLQKPIYYHSYPGTDSQPPTYFNKEKRIKIKEDDKSALDDFINLGGKICDWDHFKQTIFGNPKTNTLGFVPPNSPISKKLEYKLRSENAYWWLNKSERNEIAPTVAEDLTNIP